MHYGAYSVHLQDILLGFVMHPPVYRWQSKTVGGRGTVQSVDRSAQGHTHAR